MSAAVSCRRAGCSGTIVDGYCDVCGLAPLAAPSAPAPSPPPSAPATEPASTGASARTGASATSITTATGRSTRRSTANHSRLGAGLVRVAPQPPIDPTAAVLPSAEVAEDKRFCSNCGEPVGRRRGDQPGRVQGFCGSCGRRFDFVPKLRAGDLVGGQYDIAGCLAHGGLGWIYLARDRRVADRWVVLKGLLDAGDAEAMRAAMNEKRFLAEVEHPSIVKIFNFVEHDGAGYIVMEYVGGTSLKGILTQRRAVNGGRADPLPVAVAIAYILGILPAFQYLHERGYVYCDFKPDNLIQQGEDVKLIDLGGVRRLDDTDSVIYGTVGFQAPEIAEQGPSPSSDLYTVGRTLAVLTMDWRTYQTQDRHALPVPADQPLLARYPAFYRFLRRATADDPAVRFGDADEMATQLLGVLRQVVAVEGDGLRPYPSSLFGTDRTTVVDDDDVTDEPDYRVLPMLRLDTDDPASAFLASMDVSDPARLATQISSAIGAHLIPESAEAFYRLTRALIDSGQHERAVAALVEHDQAGADWRTHWYRGLAALAHGDPATAEAQFVDVVNWLPGELAPQVALGLALEGLDRHGDAIGLYDVARRADQSYVSATLGLARANLAVGNLSAAFDAFRTVAKGTRAHTDAQLALARSLVRGWRASGPGIDELAEASEVFEHLQLDPVRRARASVDVLGDALAWLDGGGVAPQPKLSFLGQPFTVAGVRRNLEQAYRTMARVADGDERVELVDHANRIRPRTVL